MTREKAQEKLNDFENEKIETYINFDEIEGLINEIYEDIGTCKTCKYYDNEICKGLDVDMFVPKDFYCANFEKNPE